MELDHLLISQAGQIIHRNIRSNETKNLEFDYQ